MIIAESHPIFYTLSKEESNTRRQCIIEQLGNLRINIREHGGPNHPLQILQNGELQPDFRVGNDAPEPFYNMTEAVHGIIRQAHERVSRDRHRAGQFRKLDGHGVAMDRHNVPIDERAIQPIEVVDGLIG